jgi:cell division septation protein DedD
MAGFNRDFNDQEVEPVFDGGEDEKDAESSNLPILMVISLLLLAALGGVVWVAYNNGVAHGKVGTVVQVARTPASEPSATAPGSGEPAQAKAEKPFTQPIDAPNDTGAAAAAPAAKIADAGNVQPKQVATKPPAQLVPAQKTQPPPPLPAKPAPQPAKPAPAAVSPPPATAKPVPAGAAMLQIGSFKSEGDAMAAWKGYQAKHGGLLAGVGPDVQKADLGDKGVWYRLRVGPFAGKDAAATLCGRLKAEGGACIPAK